MIQKCVASVFLLIGFLFTNSTAQIINISELYQNDNSGLPLLMNQMVTISGEVTASDQFGITSSVEDRTGGVAVYDASFASIVAIGDSVVISGVVTNYNGLTELKNVAMISRVLKSPAINPLVVNCHDLATEGVNGIERLEGKLIRINDVTVNTSNWSVSGSGSNFTLTDSSGTCEIRIDKDTNIANTSAPAGSFDVIGIVSQYDPSSPYTSGYQLMPRFKNDILGAGSLNLVTGPQEQNISSHSIDISWVTATETNSILIYGKTMNYEIDTIFVDESSIQHLIRLNGLDPATVYHLKVGAGQVSGINFSDDYVIITASDPASTGDMRVYFNQSVDHSYARYQQASKVNILSKFIQRVNSAKYSIDACFYNITMEEVAQVFIGAYQRGVKVRVIYDYDQRDPYDSNAIKQIKDANIPIISDKFGNNSGNAAMHNKFMIVDHRDTTSAADDWVWTGSFNLTFSATYENAENVIEIQDQALAECFTLEFNEMWGSEADLPNSANSKFGSRKTNNTPHRFNINDIEVLQFMSPSDNGLQDLVREIGQAQSSLYFCMLIFSNSEIANAMKQKWQTIGNFKVKGVFEAENAPGSQYDNLIGAGSYPWNPPADVHLDNETNLLHHKYLIIDGDGGAGHPVLITGSYNWSYAAENSNDENFLIIKDTTIANLYFQEFAARYHKAGGSEKLTYTSVEENPTEGVPTTSQLFQNYPNPFNSATMINYQIPGHAYQDIELAIYNILGQKIKTLVSQKQAAGLYSVQWDGKNETGELVRSGIYVYQLIVDDVKLEKKLILLQ